jgi:hypothetical protein
MNQSPAWTPEQDALLRELWAEGLSAEKIAQRIPGRSRNSVIGRAHRMGLAPRQSPIEYGLTEEQGRERRRVAQRARNARRQRGKMAMPPRPGPVSIAMMTRDDDLPEAETRFAMKADRPRAELPPRTAGITVCQWIACEKRRGYTDADKCGRPAVAGAYCAEHWQRSRNPKHTAERRVLADLGEIGRPAP